MVVPVALSFVPSVVPIPADVVVSAIVFAELVGIVSEFVFTDRLTIPSRDALSKPNTRALLLVLAAHIVETLPFLMLLGDQLAEL